MGAPQATEPPEQVGAPQATERPDSAAGPESTKASKPTEAPRPSDAPEPTDTPKPLDPEAARDRIAAAVPEPVLDLVRQLWAAGHAAYLVGGSLRDVLLGRPVADWDLATDARPDEIVAIFPDATYENQFGTVGVRRRDGVHEITTFRSEHEYADFRRPHRVEFGERIEDDLARRDFTINAIAWGVEPSPREVEAPSRRVEPPLSGGKAPPSGAEPPLGVEPPSEVEPPSGVEAPQREVEPRPTSRRPQADLPRPRLVDPHGGLADLAARRIRAVGDPRVRFGEDALRMVRAVRLAAVLDFEIEPATLAAIRERADLVRYLSGERIAAELTKLLAAARPSVGLRLLAETGLLERLLPELAAQRGVPQAKIPGDDLWAHTLRTVDAAPTERPIVRLAALLHDVGKPETAADGHFPGHEIRGAELATTILRRLRFPRETIERVAHLVRHHMFSYEGTWSDAAVRRFIARVGRDALDELFALRRADNIGSGLAPDATGLAELEARVSAILEGPVVLDRRDLAVDGHDLIRELGLEPGPRLGRILDALLERVVADPSLNERPTLLLLARGLAEGE
ncbi:MAG TPA: HD domain-containing protein [Candidatus Binatia bacterium]|nr:HD domain-containing protein [Candidatus Binatia bacterium]